MAKALLSDFMEAANILRIDGLSDKDKVEKNKENPVLLESLKENSEEVFESDSEESFLANEGGLSCTICGFVTTAKSKGNQTAVMSRHNRRAHGEYADIHLSDNSDRDPKEEKIITLDEDVYEPDQEEPSLISNAEESCHICGFKSVAKSKGNRSMVLKRHMATAHESKSKEIIAE